MSHHGAEIDLATCFTREQGTSSTPAALVLASHFIINPTSQLVEGVRKRECGDVDMCVRLGICISVGEGTMNASLSLFAISSGSTLIRPSTSNLWNHVICVFVSDAQRVIYNVCTDFCTQIYEPNANCQPVAPACHGLRNERSLGRQQFIHEIEATHATFNLTCSVRRSGPQVGGRSGCRKQTPLPESQLLPPSTRAQRRAQSDRIPETARRECGNVQPTPRRRRLPGPGENAAMSSLR
jgi:hypothetical protein